MPAGGYRFAGSGLLYAGRMAEAWIAAHPTLPWGARQVARTPLSPLWVGLGIALGYALLLALYVAVLAASGEEALVRSRFLEHGHWRTGVVNGVMVAFAPTFLVYALRGTREDLRELQPALGCSDAELDHLGAELTRLDVTRLRLVGAGAVVVMLLFTWFDPGLWSTRPRPALDDPLLLWQLARQALVGWLWARAITADLQLVRAFGRLAERLERVDLLDQRALLPFTRRGVRSVLGWMAASVVFSLFWLHPDAGQANLVGLLFLLGVAGATLLLPLWGIHCRLRAEKLAQLERVRDAIRSDQSALLGRPAPSPEAAARLPALLAVEGRLMAVPEWPFDTSSVLRIALYLSLGIGSWVGAALVERTLGAVLG